MFGQKMIDFAEAALCLKTIAHPHRLEMIHYLIEHGKASVGELAEELSIESSATSEHLTLLKDRDLLFSTKEGRKVYYFIKEPTLKSIMSCVKKKFSN